MGHQNGVSSSSTTINETVVCAKIVMTPTVRRPGENPKTLQDDRAVIQVDMKDIFVGFGNYRIPWKHVTQVTLDEETTNGWFVIDSEAWIVEGFIPNVRGQREKFHKILEKCWTKQQRKRSRKQQREQEEREEAERMEAVKRRKHSFGSSMPLRHHGGTSSSTTFLSSPSRRGMRSPTKTYSKRRNKFDKFLRQNENANNWDSDDDDEIFNTRTALDEKKKSSKNRHDEEEGANHDGGDDDNDVVPMEADDNEEEEFNDDGSKQAVSNEEGDDDEAVGGGEAEDDDEDSASTNNPPALNDENEERQEDDDEDDRIAKTPKNKILNKKRRLVKQKKRVLEDDSDDDELFSNSHEDRKGFTTSVTPSRKVVSPETGSPIGGKTAHQFIEDSDDDEPIKGQQSISNFFSSKKTLSSPVNSNKRETKPTATNTSLTSVGFIPASALKDTDMGDATPNEPAASSSKETATPASTEEITTPTQTKVTKDKPKPLKFHSFFEPRKTKKDAGVSTSVDNKSPDDDRSSATTVRATESPDLPDDIEEDSGSQTPEAGDPITPLNSPKRKQYDLPEDPVVSTPPTLLKQSRVPRKDGIRGRTYGKPNRKTYGSQLNRDFSSSTAGLALAPNPTSRMLTFETPGSSSFIRQRQGEEGSPKPTSPVRTWYWRGLKNLGNSCYMNASLQMLYSVRGLVARLRPFQAEHRPLVNSFCKLRQDLVNRHLYYAANPQAIKNAVDEKTNKFRGFRQRDAHEFLGDFIDQIHEELEDEEGTHDDKQTTPESESAEATTSHDQDDNVGLKDTDNEGKKTESKDEAVSSSTKRALPTDEQFRLTVQVCLTCKSCGFSRTKDELYRYLSVDIVDSAFEEPNQEEYRKRTVENCLQQFFRPEDREIKCEKCEDGTVAEQTLRILSR